MLIGKKVGVIIPCYNCELTIQSVIDTIPHYIDKVILVDDGSNDGTLEIIKSNLSDPRFHLISHIVNLGVGAAMKSGFVYVRDSNIDIVVKMDSDGQMDPHYIPSLLYPIIKYDFDFSKGNRFLYRDSIKVMPLIRLIGNSGLSILSKISTGYWKLFDPTNGFLAVKVNTLRKMNLAYLSDTYYFEISFLTALNIYGKKVCDVFIPAIYNGEKSSLSIRRTLIEFPFKLFISFIKRIFVKYLIKDFSPIIFLVVSGVFFFTIGCALALFYWIREVSSENPIGTPTGSLLIALVAIILGYFNTITGFVLEASDSNSYSTFDLDENEVVNFFHQDSSSETIDKFR